MPPRGASAVELGSRSAELADVGVEVAAADDVGVDGLRDEALVGLLLLGPRRLVLLGAPSGVLLGLGEDLGVARLALEQLGVRALRDDPAVLDHRDAVGEADASTAGGR